MSSGAGDLVRVDDTYPGYLAGTDSRITRVRICYRRDKEGTEGRPGGGVVSTCDNTVCDRYGHDENGSEDL